VLVLPLPQASSGDRANPWEFPLVADPTGEPSPATSGVDDPYCQVVLDQWMQLGPSNRLGNILAGPAQSKLRTARALSETIVRSHRAPEVRPRRRPLGLLLVM